MIKPEQLVDQQLGSYRLTEFLKGGGFGFVYKAEHVKLQKNVAVKLLRPEHVLKEEYVAAFEREAKIIASFTHPHILDVYDYAVFHGIPFLVMPFIEQGSLRTLHPRNSIVETPTIVFYVKQVASALQYAHDHKFVHRDVKPDNFLRGPQGILLSDFGITITAHRVDSLSLQDRAGTLAYMAPEQFDRKAQIWSDQYSLAVVIYEWLCGKLPFFSESISEIERKHKEEYPPSFKQQGVDVLPSIEKVVRKGLAKKPEERYPSVTAFAEALERAVLEPQAAIKSSPIPINPIPRLVRPSPPPQNAPLPASKAGQAPQSPDPKQSDLPNDVDRQQKQPSPYKSVQPPDQESRTAHGNNDGREGRNDPRYKAILDQIRAHHIVSNPQQIARDVLKAGGRLEINTGNRINYSQRNKPKLEQHQGIPIEVQAPILAAQLVINTLGEVRVPEYVHYDGMVKIHVPGSTLDVVAQVIQEQGIQTDNISYNALLAKLEECMHRKDISDIKRVHLHRVHCRTRDNLYRYIEEALQRRDNIRLGLELNSVYSGSLSPAESCVKEMANILNDLLVFGRRQIQALVDTYFANLNPYPEGSQVPGRQGKNREWTQETWEQNQQENRDILAARLAVIKQSYASGHFMHLALIGLDRIKQTTPEPIRPYMVLPKIGG
ncbi:MAG: serine/threonine protein kinase [Ktedonobacteraceae bacterium]